MKSLSSTPLYQLDKQPKKDYSMESSPLPYLGRNNSKPEGFINYSFEPGFSSIINAELVVGKLSANCRGNGICKMLPLGSVVAKCSALRCTLIRRDLDQLNIVFFPQDCCPGMRKKVFSSDSFVIEEPFQLPAWVRKALSYNGESLIPAGVYPILHFRECAFISFRLYGNVHSK